jgi:hypothetical protein
VDGVTDARATVWRWRPAYQNDFEARMDWCAAPSLERANHAPAAVLNGDRSRNIVHLRARPGERVRLDASGSSDPDGHRLALRWFAYPEAGTYQGAVKLQNHSAGAAFTVPEAAEQTIHVVLEVKDDGAPPLYAYRRAVVTVR